MTKTVKKLVSFIMLSLFFSLSGYSQKIFKAEEDDFSANNRKMDKLYTNLNDYYVEKLNFSNLTEAAIKSILSNLDPFAIYLTREEVMEVKKSFYSNLFDLNCRDYYYALLSDEEKLKLTNDTFLASYLSKDEEKESSIDVAYRMNDTISYIKVNKFSNSTSKDIENAIIAMPGTKGLIIDLRDNGGGFFQQAIAAVDIFIPMGCLITYTEGRRIARTDTHSVSQGVYEKGKLAILVDESSASASELLAGALQDWDRATIIGRPTFGKGVVQQQIEFEDGSAMRVTVARYHTPCGRVIQRPYDLGTFSAVPHKTDTSSYYSLRKGRILKAGGGIQPDIIIEKDSSNLYPAWSYLIESGQVVPKLLKYIDDNEKQLMQTYVSLDNYHKNYVTPKVLVEEILTNNLSFDIVRSTDKMEKLRHLIAVQLKAAIAQKLWGEGSYYKIINMQKDNRYIVTAIDVLKN